MGVDRELAYPPILSKQIFTLSLNLLIEKNFEA